MPIGKKWISKGILCGIFTFVAVQSCAHRRIEPGLSVLANNYGGDAIVAKFYSPQESLLLKVCTGSKNGCNESEIFSIYCGNGRQIIPLTTKFQTVLVRPPLGVPLDKANEELNRIESYMRETVYGYYHESFYNPSIERRYGTGAIIPKRSLKAPWATKETFIRDRFLDGEEYNIPIFAPIWKNRSDFISQLKNIRLPNSKYYLNGKMFYVDRDNASEPIILSFGSAYKGRNLDRLSESLTMARVSDEHQGGNVVALVYEKQAPFELQFFSENFTMLIPKDQQEMLSGKHNREYFFLNADGSFNLNQAINSRYSLWHWYISKFQSVKEAQSEDPQVKSYEVSLDLNTFCAYGRPISSFLTK